MPQLNLRTALATAGVIALAFAGCGGDDDSDATDTTDGDTTEAAVPTITAGTLAVCSDIPYEPFEFEGDGPSGYTGFDIELINAIAGEHDLELAVTDVDFDGILGNLEAESCDVVASALTINDERAQEVDFTESYFDAEQSLLVKSDSGYAALADLAGKNIGVQSATTGEDYANDNTPDGATVTAFDGADALFAALEAGEIDAILQDLPVNGFRTTKDDTLSVVETYTTDEVYGFAVKKGNAELLTALDEGLASVRASGTYDELYAEYFGDEPGE